MLFLSVSILHTHICVLLLAMENIFLNLLLHHFQGKNKFPQSSWVSIIAFRKIKANSSRGTKMEDVEPCLLVRVQLHRQRSPSQWNNVSILFFYHWQYNIWSPLPSICAVLPWKFMRFHDEFCALLREIETQLVVSCSRNCVQIRLMTCRRVVRPTTVLQLPVILLLQYFMSLF